MAISGILEARCKGWGNEVKEMKEHLAELEPNFLKIKDEVENQIKKEREKSG